MHVSGWPDVDNILFTPRGCSAEQRRNRHAARSRNAGASAGPVAEEIFDRITDLEYLAVEQMIGRVDDDELLWIGSARVELLHLLQRTEFVAFALNEELRFRARANRFKVVPGQRRRDSEERRHSCV